MPATRRKHLARPIWCRKSWWASRGASDDRCTPSLVLMICGAVGHLKSLVLLLTIAICYLLLLSAVVFTVELPLYSVVVVVVLLRVPRVCRALPLSPRR